MLIVARNVSDLKVFTLAEVYDLVTLDEGQDFYGFLRDDFFPDGICCISTLITKNERKDRLCVLFLLHNAF